MMDLSGLPDQAQPEAGGDLLSGLPDTNAGTLRKQYRSTALSPDTAAKVIDLSARSGLPRVTVEKNMPIAEQRASEPDWNALETTAPITAQTLAANSKMFEIAHDDTENLSSTEKVFGELARHVKGVAGSLSAGVMNDTNAAVWGWAEGGAKALGANKAGDYFKSLRKFQEEQAAGAQGGYGAQGFAENSVASGVRSMGSMAPGLLASVMTGNPAFSLGMGSAQSGGQTVGKGLDAGLSPVNSLVYGAEDATAEWATEMLPMGMLIRDLKLGAPLYKLLAHQIATEVPTEMAATAWQNFNEWANVNPEMSFSGYLEKLGPDEALTISSTIVQTVLSAGLAHGTSKILQRATTQQEQADSAMKSADGLAQLAQLAANSKLRARDPKTFQQFVEAANEDGGVQDVYIDTNTLLQSGVDLEVLAKLSPVVAEQLKQPNIGGDLVIPVGEYAARIAGSEIDAALAPHLRTSEDALSSFEAQTFYQNQAEEFKKASEQIMEERATDDAWTTSAKAVETQLFDQLKQTKRFTDDVNKVNSTLMRDFYVTTAGRLNITPEEMFARYPLQVSGESMAGAKTMEQDIQTPAFKNWFGESKVVDSKGAPLVVYHGTAKKFTKFSFKDAGQKIIWFTSDKNAIDKGEVGAQGQGVTMDLYASIKNPAGWAEYDKLGLDELQARGYDGVILPESDGTFSGFVFDGKQLKSASRNRGTFDPKNPSILAQAANKVKQVLGLQQEQPQKGGLAMGQFFNQPASQDRAVSLRALADEGNNQAVVAQTLIDSASAAGVKNFSDILVGVALLPESDSLGGIPALSPVLSQMRRTILDDNKILDAVIAAAPVGMVDNLAGGESAAKVALHNEAMLQDSPAFNADLPISETPEATRPVGLLVRKVALRAAKTFLSTDAGRKAAETSPTEGASKDNRLGQGGPSRAEITLADDITSSPTVLSLLKNADLSSFLHEMGHFQLEVMAHIASQPNAPVEIVNDLNAVLGWFGIKGGEVVAGGEKSGALGQPDNGPAEREYEATEKLYRNTDGWLKAPNGGPTRLTESQWIRTRTPAFKNWFGDFENNPAGASKVVDLNGDPLVVYHGTPKEVLFTEFYTGNVGAFFTDNPSIASTFTPNSDDVEFQDGAAFTESGEGGVYEVFLDIKNPKTVESGRWGFDIEQQFASGKREGFDGGIAENVEDGGRFGFADIGNQYVVFDPTQIKSAIGNSGAFNPADPNILRQDEDITQPNAADLPPGRTPLEVWQAMSLEEKRPFHEQFARGFEAYLFEGKAPSVELNGIFARVRAWLINVYKSMAALKVEINDDIRRVFDRLLATDEAIKQAESMRSYGALFTSADQMGVDAEEWAEYQRTGQEATDSAVDDLQRKSLGDMRWLTNARNRTLKKLQQDAKAKRSAVQEEVTAEVQEMPLYAALRFIRQGEGNNVTKLSLPDLKELYGEEPAAPWRYLPVGLAANEGLRPDHIAELFGFTSGDHLVRAILEQSSEKDMIEGMTDQRMLERYGDINSPDALNRAADEAIHNAARARFVATELKALDKANTPARVIAQAAKAFAEAMIARKKVREIRPSQHAAAELRAAKAALKAMINGDTRAAAIEKRNQLIQNLSTKEAYNALGEIEKAVRYLRKFDKEGPRKSIDVDYLDQIDQLLERFDFRASVTNKAAKKRESLLAWLEEQRLQGFEPDIPQELQTEALRKPYRELTVEELRGLIDTVKQIEHLGRLKRKLLTSKDAREFQAIRDEIAASIEEHAKKTVDLRTRSNTAEALKSGGKHFLAMHRKMASLARELDGFKDGGPMWEYFIRSMNSAGDTETTKRGDATARLFELVKPLLSGGKMGGKGRYFETLQGSFNREERIAIALNLGNAGNTQRLLDGEGWSMAQLRPLLDTITPEEAAFVQNIWDFFESYRPEIAAKERRVYGKEPNWVEPTPITLGGQQLRGGYYPIRYDANRTGKAEQFAAAEEAKAQMKGAFTSSTTRRSFTKPRAEEVVGRPLVYSFSGLYLGANEVIHDLAWHEWLVDANRLVRSLDGVIRLHYGPEGVAVFKKGIEDIAAGDAGAANAFEKGLNHIRTGATIAGLGWNLTTSLFQPLGLLPSMARVGPGWMAKGIGQFLAHPKRVSGEIIAKSAMMTDRAKTMQREINEIQNQIQASKLDPIRSTFFVLIQKAQWVADAPTWLGAYEKATAEGNDEERAVALADQAVLDSQGGGQTKDLAQIQRGGPLLKLWTNFYSYFNTVYNLGAEKTNEKIGSPKLYPSLALDYLLLYIAPAALITILRDALSGGDDDDLVKKMLADQISNLTGLMIGLREVTTAMQKVAGVEQYKGSYGGPAGLRLFQELDKLGQQVGQGEADEALFKSINNVGGIVFHYPSGQVARTVGGAAAMFEGKTENPASLVLGPPRK
jgi:hypothetical protein